MIHEEVENPFGEGLLAEIDLELEHVNKFITMVTYDIAINIPGMPGAAQFPPQDDMEHGDDPNGGQPGLRGTIPIPNGSYHIWFDLDLNMDMQPFPGGDEFPPEDQPPEGEEMM
ncbi:MAG: hypothetical protein GY868_07875 [Deltaproteobacteria bacterium]|nr:hypothetical protein [Deltaproteobacteria bacterium]